MENFSKRSERINLKGTRGQRLSMDFSFRRIDFQRKKKRLFPFFSFAFRPTEIEKQNSSLFESIRRQVSFLVCRSETDREKIRTSRSVEFEIKKNNSFFLAIRSVRNLRLVEQTCVETCRRSSELTFHSSFRFERKTFSSEVSLVDRKNYSKFKDFCRYKKMEKKRQMLCSSRRDLAGCTLKT